LSGNFITDYYYSGYVNLKEPKVPGCIRIRERGHHPYEGWIDSRRKSGPGATFTLYLKTAARYKQFISGSPPIIPGKLVDNTAWLGVYLV